MRGESSAKTPETKEQRGRRCAQVHGTVKRDFGSARLVRGGGASNAAAAQSRCIPPAEITQYGNTAFEKVNPLMIGAVLSLPESVCADKPFVWARRGYRTDTRFMETESLILDERFARHNKIFSFRIANESYW